MFLIFTKVMYSNVLAVCLPSQDFQPYGPLQYVLPLLSFSCPQPIAYGKQYIQQTPLTTDISNKKQVQIQLDQFFFSNEQLYLNIWSKLHNILSEAIYQSYIVCLIANLSFKVPKQKQSSIDLISTKLLKPLPSVTGAFSFLILDSHHSRVAGVSIRDQFKRLLLDGTAYMSSILCRVLCILRRHCPHFNSRLCVLQEQADIANMLSSGVQVIGHFPVGSACSCRGLIIGVDIGSYVNLVKMPFSCVQRVNPKHLGQLTGIWWDQGLHEANLIMLLVESISILLLLSHSPNPAVTLHIHTEQFYLCSFLFFMAMRTY